MSENIGQTFSDGINAINNNDAFGLFCPKNMWKYVSTTSVIGIKLFSIRFYQLYLSTHAFTVEKRWQCQALGSKAYNDS